MKYCNAKPVLRVSDYQRAKTFYTEVLGFEPITEAGEPDPGFGIFRAGDAMIFLSAWDGAEVPYAGWRAHFYMDDLIELVAHLSAVSCVFKGPTVTAYNMKEVEVTDPDGNVLCFGTEMPTAESAQQ
ncbi:Glyoxalase family protein [Sulfitobacter noctilucae]|uniref:glyoxalase superfamily protein n=1 Tax=Sulfitobacter noctilucae TaxID=1342302 RepID=UPI0004691DA8|nr:glyoxalase superfamily protein [Sulfitobacter noctilucae]KIN61541.1 Glyoxalase family protein [Sulfitobacter noctilucae]